MLGLGRMIRLTRGADYGRVAGFNFKEASSEHHHKKCSQTHEDGER